MLDKVKENAIQLNAIVSLVNDAKENDRFFFHCMTIIFMLAMWLILFIVSGHSTQEDTDDIEEEDGKNECGYEILNHGLDSSFGSVIIGSDGQTIKDDVRLLFSTIESDWNLFQELRDYLVKPLPPKCSLIVSSPYMFSWFLADIFQAVFDSCHSGSLLDLKHFRCNQVYVPWLNKGQRRTDSLWNSTSE